MLENYIDLTILRADACYEDVKKICKIVQDKGYRSACIPPIYVNDIKKEFGKKIKICSVVGFPLGNIDLYHKIEEYRELSKAGVDELDIVLSIGLIKSGRWDIIQDEIASLSNHVEFWHTPIKLILEVCYLTDEEIIKICRMCEMYNILALKTSTGYGNRGVLVKDVKLMRTYLRHGINIKASGGIKTEKQAFDLIEAGANIIGTSKVF